MDAERLLGDAKSSLGDVKSSLADVKSSLQRCRVHERAGRDNLFLPTIPVAIRLHHTNRTNTLELETDFLPLIPRVRLFRCDSCAREHHPCGVAVHRLLPPLPDHPCGVAVHRLLPPLPDLPAGVPVPCNSRCSY